MLKMIMALPTHIDAENFVSVTMDVIKGRYGKDGYYNGVMPFISVIMYPTRVSKEFVRGFSGKNGLRYYEIDAQELDPVIIATLEELGAMVGMDYAFVNDERTIGKNWWRPFGEFQTWKGRPYYCEDVTLDNARETYDKTLQLLNRQKKYA